MPDEKKMQIAASTAEILKILRSVHHLSLVERKTALSAIEAHCDNFRMYAAAHNLAPKLVDTNSIRLLAVCARLTRAESSSYPGEEHYISEGKQSVQLLKRLLIGAGNSVKRRESITVRSRSL